MLSLTAAAESKFEIIKKLGEGAFGVVYLAKDRLREVKVALKFVKDLDGKGIPPSSLREISVLRSLCHPHIVHLIDVNYEVSPKSLYLVFEHCNYDLRCHLREHVLPMSDIKRFLRQILDALAFTHANRIFHRDLKPGNILVSADGQNIKLADFGMAREYQLPLRTYTREFGTRWYCAPEILLGTMHYSAAVDIWSVGTIMVELATRRPFAPGDSEIDQLFKIFQILGTPTEAEWPAVPQLRDFCPQFPKWQAKDLARLYPQFDSDGIDLLRKMLRYDEGSRITACEALRHPWFAVPEAVQSAPVDDIA